MMKPPTLQRLLALNKSGTAFEHDLREAASILQLPQEWPSFDPSIAEELGKQYSTQKRAEWLLKWLLERLNAQDVQNDRPRQLPLAWTFLTWLILLCPLHITSKQLAYANFLSILQRTLADLNTLSPDLASHHGTVLLRASESDSRKRKRGSESPIVNDYVREPSADLLVALDLLLQVLDRMTEAVPYQNATQASVEQLRVVLKTSVEQAAEILRLWQINLCQVIQATGRTRFTLSPILSVWQRSVLRSSIGSQSVATAFSKTCAVTAAGLLLLEKDDDTTSRQLNKQLEDLLLRYIILPARSAAIMVWSKSRRVRPETTINLVLLDELLEPFREEMLRLSRSYGKRSAEAEAFIHVFPRILDLALGGYQNVRPKVKAQEESWLQSLFVALSRCAASSITDNSISTVHSLSDMVHCRLLDVCIEHSYSPGIQLLESLTRLYSGMCLPEEERMLWGLIAKVLRVDSNVFLPGGNSSRKPDVFANAGPLDKLIVKHLSSMPWLSEYDSHSLAHATVLRGEDGLSESGRAFKDQNGIAPNEFLLSIPIALMKAYAHARDLTGFMEIWRLELIKCTHHIVIGSGNGMVWENQSVAAALRDVFESSLTERQIRDILTELTKPFEELEEAQNIMYVFTELRQHAQGTGAAANLILLDAILGAMQSDPVITLCSEQLLTLHEALLSVGSKPAISKLPIMHRLWRTLSSIHRLLLPVITASQRSTLFEATIVSGCVQVAVEAVREASVTSVAPPIYERAMFAFTFLLSIYACEDVPQLEMATLEQCIDCITVCDEMPRHLLASQLLCFPRVFQLLAASKRKSLFDWIVRQSEPQSNSRNDAAEQRAVKVRFMPVLDALVELSQVSFSAGVRNDLLDSISHSLRHLDKHEQSIHTIHGIESILTRFPASMLSRSLREECINRVHEFIALGGSTQANVQLSSDQWSLEFHLAFLVKLMEVPNATSELCKNAHLVLHLCKDQDLAAHPDCRTLYEELVRRILTHVSSQSPLPSLMAMTILEDSSTSFASPRYSLWLAIRPLITQVEPELRQRLLLHETKIFSHLNQCVLDRIPNPSSIHVEIDQVYSMLLDSLRGHWAYIEGSEECLKEIQQWDLLQATSAHARRLPESKIVVDRFLLAMPHISAFDLCLAAQNAIQTQQPLKNRRQILTDLQVQLMKQPIEHRLDVITQLDDLLLGQAFSYPSLEVLQILLLTLPRSVKSLDEFELKVDVLSRLSEQLRTCTDARVFYSICECIKIMLRERHWLVSQHGVDTLLSRLTVIVSASAPALPIEAAGSVYTQVCSLVTIAVSLQRIKLQGRFHLVMPLLINLLRCLFVPHSRSSRTDGLGLPHWIPAKNSSISAKHATAYGRLLSTLSSPTMSAVSSYKRHHTSSSMSLPLKDETKAARIYVGEYIPILLAAYCAAQLNGRMPPEVKSALMPGLWSCMETVEMDAWRAMSERMQENDRAVWQSVWAEWKRVGGGSRDR